MYRLTWKTHTTPSGRSISRLRGSGHRISANGAFSGPTIYDLPQVVARDIASGALIHGGALSADAALTSWPTPMAGNPGKPGVYNPAGNTDASRKTVALAGWMTPLSSGNCETAEAAMNEISRVHAGGISSLTVQCHLAGWGTPTTRDYKDGASVGTIPVNGVLGRQVWLIGPARLTVSGEMLTGSSAQMSDGGQLNPAFSRWLMGFPAAWGSCGVTAMQSCRKSRRNS
jgi:hypothetical protein